jgi:feruloyl esterase
MAPTKERGLMHRHAIAMALAIAPVATASAHTATCESLAKLSLPNVKIVSAVPVTPPVTLPDPDMTRTVVKVPFCRVTGVSTPTRDSEIRFEVWLPLQGRWNGAYLQNGNGGTAGHIRRFDMTRALHSGYATAATDDGHRGKDLTFVENPNRLIDYAYRAVHETSRIAKLVVKAYYGRAPRRAYFRGDSKGGQEGIMSAHRFPGDFDGIVAGAPINDMTNFIATLIHVDLAFEKDPAGLPKSKLALLNRAVLKACSAQKAVDTDLFLTDSFNCRFDPAALECKGPDGPGCLTKEQVAAVKMIYAGATNPRTNEFYPGLEPGSEFPQGVDLAAKDPPKCFGCLWSSGTGLYFGKPFFGSAVFDDDDWACADFDFDRDMATVKKKLGPIVNAVGDLREFKARGGKLLMYHGNFDNTVPVRGSLAYYKSLHGGTLAEIRKFARYFLVPGHAHGLGGPGPNAFGGIDQPDAVPFDREHDIVAALDHWVEHGVAPERIIATKYVNDDPSQGITMTRPICAYPLQPRYKGSGDKTKATSFVCANGTPDNVPTFHRDATSGQ